MWWPLLLIPLLVWAVYAIGTPWPDSAPVGASLETYGVPWDIQDMQRVLREHGHQLTVQSIHPERRNHAGRSIGLHEDSFVRAVVEFDGGQATLNVYPDTSSMQVDWTDDGGLLQPRDNGVLDNHVLFTGFDNIVVVEGNWLYPAAGLGEALQDLDR